MRGPHLSPYFMSRDEVAGGDCRRPRASITLNLDGAAASRDLFSLRIRAFMAITKKERRELRPYPTVSSVLTSRSFDRTENDNWEIGIYGDLSDKQPELFGRLIELPKRSRGIIFFDSCGGSVYIGLALASLILLRGLEATGVVVGECSSAALLPFAACRKRFVTMHATLLFHPVRWQGEDDMRREDAAEWARHFHELESDVDRLLARLFPVSEERLNEWTRPGKFVSGHEIVAEGLAEPLDLFAGDVWSQLARVAPE